MTPEGKVKAEIKAYLDSIGAYYFMPVQMGYGVRGTPDFLVCWRGKFIGIEAKASTGKPSAFQKLVAQRIAEAGGTCLMAYSGEEVQRKFELLP